MLYDSENKPKTIHLNIKEGCLMQFMGNDQADVPHHAVEGVITSISVVTKVIKNRPYRYLYVYMTDGEENYAIQVPLLKSAGPNIIRSLKSAIDAGSIDGKKIKIETYPKEKDGTIYTNATIYMDGQKLSWAPIAPDQDHADALEDMAEEIRLRLLA